ncbi:hypothetical protein ACLMCB_03500 [Paenibacillus sp. S29]
MDTIMMAVEDCVIFWRYGMIGTKYFNALPRLSFESKQKRREGSRLFC